MLVMRSNAKHGSRARYVAGCRCAECNQANTVYQQNLKERKRIGSLTSLPGGGDADGSDQPQVGRVETGVLRELLSLSAAQSQPGLVEAALQMARIMDAPQLATTHPAAMRQLTIALDKLRNASAGRKGKLADVAAMSQRKQEQTG